MEAAEKKTTRKIFTGKIIRRLCIGFLGFVLFLLFSYSVIGFWVLPSYIQSKAQRFAAETLQRELVIHRLDFNPFTFSLNVQGLSLSEAGSKEIFFSFERLEIELSARSVFKMTPVVTELKLTRPFLRIARISEEKRNFDDIYTLFVPAAAPDGEPQTAPESTARRKTAAERRAERRERRFGIYNFEMVDARIELLDQQKGEQTVISEFSMGLPYIYRGPVRGIWHHVEPHLEAVIDGERLDIVREALAEGSRDRTLTLSHSNFDLTRITRYAPIHSSFHVNKGRLDLQIRLTIHRPRGADASVDVGGHVALRSFDMTHQGKPLVSFEKLDLQLGTTTIGKSHFHIRKIELIRPQVHAVSDRRGFLNLTGIFAPAVIISAPAEGEGTAKPGSGVQHTSLVPEQQETVVPVAAAQAAGEKQPGTLLSVEELFVRQADLRYSDQSESAPMHLSTGTFDLTVKDLDMDFASFALSAKELGAKGGNFMLEMHDAANPPPSVSLPPSDASSVNIRIDRLDMKDWRAKIRMLSRQDSPSVPLAIELNRLGVAAENASIDLGLRTISMTALRSAGTHFDMTFDDHPAGNPSPAGTDTSTAFIVSVGELALDNCSGRIRNNNYGDLEGLPLVTQVNNLGLRVENAQLDLRTGTILADSIRSTGARFDTLMEPRPPKVPVVSAVSDHAPESYKIRIGKLDVSGWSARVKNSNRLDPFVQPYSATLSRLGMHVEGVDINLSSQTIAVSDFRTAGGQVEVDLEPWRRPSSSGRKATARAALMQSILDAQKAGPAHGLAYSVTKVAVSDWSARIKNHNSTDRAGLPVSGRAQKISFSLGDVVLDTKKRDIRIGDIESRGVDIRAQLEKHDSADLKKRPSGAAPVVMPADDPYSIHIGKLTLVNWSVRGRNLNMTTPFGTSMTNLSITGRELSTDSGKSGPFSMQGTVDGTGSFTADGRLGLSPLNLDLALNARDIAVAGVQPYITDYVNLRIEQGSLSVDGHLQLAENSEGNLEAAYGGSLGLAGLRAINTVSEEQFLRWNMLALKEVNASFSPLMIHIKEAELDTLVSRVIINADGVLNLRDIMTGRSDGMANVSETDSELDGLANIAEVSQKGSPGTVSASEAEQAAPFLTVDKLTLKNGRVRYTDNYIQPSFTANITALEGTVTGLSSDPDTAARLDFAGLVNHAPLTAAGHISLFRDTLGLEVKAQVRGMELAQFSSYTARYIGYGIEKGKLSFDVEYKLEDGVLVAQNRLILDQLTIGDKVPGDQGGSLPIQLAISLLKDSKGVIDVNLPIGGSLEDPQFSIGAIMARVALNSVRRLITAPFSFLSSQHGKGSAELSWLEFEAGSSAIPEKETPKLEVLAAALSERPALSLDITGRYDVESDSVGLAKASVHRRMRQIMRRDLQGQGQSGMPALPDEKDKAYADLVERLFNEEEIRRPRNIIGIARKLTVSEMEEMLISHHEAHEDEFRTLAFQRAERVKAWLMDKGKIADTRIFILSSRAGQTGEEGEAASRVDFALR